MKDFSIEDNDRLHDLYKERDAVNGKIAELERRKNEMPSAYQLREFIMGEWQSTE